MNTKYNNYYIEECVFEDFLEDERGLLFFCKGYLGAVLKDLYKRSDLKFNKIVFKEDTPLSSFVKNTRERIEEYELTRTKGKNKKLSKDSKKTLCKFHFLSIVEKDLYEKKKLTSLTRDTGVKVIKLLNNEGFLKDVNTYLKKYGLRQHTRINYTKVLDASDNSFAILIATLKELDVIIDKYNAKDLPYTLLFDIILLKKESVLENIEDILLSNMLGDITHNCTVYLIRNEKEGILSLKSDINGDAILDDIKRSYVAIDYFQNKYFKKGETNKTKIRNIEEYYKLLALENKKMEDWEIADEIFNPGEDTPMISPTEDKKRRNRIRKIRERGKKYFNT